MGIRADRGKVGGRPEYPSDRKRDVRLSRQPRNAGLWSYWLTLEEAQVLLGDLTRVVREIEAERTREREQQRAAQ